MYVAGSDDHNHGRASTDLGVASYVKWRQASGQHSMYTGRINPNYRFGKYRPGMLGNYHNELVLDNGAICTAGINPDPGQPTQVGQDSGAAVLAACGWDTDGDADANPYRGRVLFKAATDGRAFMNGIIRSENGHGRILGHQTIDIFLEETDIKITNVKSHSSVGKYQVAPMHVGQRYYIDRAYTVGGLPDFLTGVQVIQTANDDKNAPATDETFLCFELSTPATVYVLFDSRATTFPAWLTAGFSNTHVAAVESTDSNMGKFTIFYEDFPNGKVCMGGNSAPGAASNYIVMAGPPVDMTCHPSHKLTIGSLESHTADQTKPYAVAVLHTKSAYYVDRDYVLTSVPSFFVGLESIKTANGDKHSAEEPTLDAAGEFATGFLCFTVTEDARVYVLYDSRASTRPAWLTTYFVDKHEESGVNHTDANMAQGFEVYSGYFPLGGRAEKRICLGGNDPTEGSSGAGSMYLVFVGPEEERCDGVAAVAGAAAAGTAAAAPVRHPGRALFVLVILASAVVAAAVLGKKYKTLHAKVASGSIYEDGKYQAYAGATEPVEMNATPLPSGGDAF
jgi:hypothetical protein